MKYRCRSLPLTKLIPTNKGFMKPLCNYCQTLDCENSIEIKKISLLGVNMEIKLLVKNDDAYMVIDCEGFMNDAKSKSNNK